MENNYGLIKNFEMNLAKTDPALVDRICNKRNIDKDYVRQIMRHNRWTFNQFADLTGLSTQTLTGYSKSIIMVDDKPTTKLQYCLPYPHLDGKGPKFIVRNETSMQFLMKTLED
jgi:hypothetical protein